MEDQKRINFMENIWEDQITKIKEKWGKEVANDFSCQKKNLFNCCLAEKLGDEYYNEVDKFPFIMVVPINTGLDINKYLSLINNEYFLSSIRKENILGCHQKYPYFIIGVENGQADQQGLKKTFKNSFPPQRKGVNLEEMLAIANQNKAFKKSSLRCTESRHKKTGEIPALGKMENQPILYWSRPELCLEYDIPSKRKNFCSI